MEYNPQQIEQKWKKYWEQHETYKVPTSSDKPKYYILDMFPYPSGAGLHVGHPLGYIASDIYARYKRLTGYNVLHPMGYDSFGLPAEQYAIQTGTHPVITTENNIKRYREQLDNIGFSFDWSREVRTSEPDYYKWTQWIFMQLFEHYYDKTADKALPISDLVKTFAQGGNATVNAVCDDETPKFTAEAWNAMSDAAQQTILLHYRFTFPGESFVNWCPALGSVLSNDEVKDGLSERGGYPVTRKRMKQWSMRITAYADRLLEGLNEIQWPDSLKDQQRNWIGRSQGASVKFQTAKMPHIDTEYTIEVFTTRVDTIYGVSFMVLAPEHELVNILTTEAQKEEVEMYQMWAGGRTEIERQSEVKKVTGAFTGAYCINPFNQKSVPIYIADYVLAGYGTGAVMAVPSGDQRDWAFAKHFGLEIIQILDAQDLTADVADNTKQGKYINSGMIDGLEYKEATAKLIDFMEAEGIGKGKIQYRLRNAVFSRQRYWGEPVPAFWKDGLPYMIQESELPLVLPSIDKYLPTTEGEPPLGRAEDWKYTDSDGRQHEYELSTMPGWAGSSWYFYRYMDPQNKSELASKAALNYWKSVDFYIGGSEHAVGHLLYSRFWNHFLYDLGIAPEREFAKRLINQGMITGRSSFVFRAKENFFEAYMMLKVLTPFFDNLKPLHNDVSELEASSIYDFEFQHSDLVIEVVSVKLLDKISTIKAAAKRNNKRLLIITTQEIIENINDPKRIAEIIKLALSNVSADFISNVATKDLHQLYVSHNLIKKYGEDKFQKLHVDVNIVENDFLNLDKAKKELQFENSNFKLDENQQYSCSFEVEKMSKSKLNVVNPDDMVAQYGADCFRMYEMFLGPIEDSKPWNTNGISGVQGFLRKLWSLFYKPNTNKYLVTDNEPTKEEYKILHTCIKKINDDIERLSYNTCVSSFMICVNDLKKFSCSKSLILKDLVVLLAPFAPFVSEELWSILGATDSVTNATFPIPNEAYLVQENIAYPIAINGKTRQVIDFPAASTKEELETAVRNMEILVKYLEGKEIKKVIVVAGKMINVVI